jgi:hypothetical protein
VAYFLPQKLDRPKCLCQVLRTQVLRTQMPNGHANGYAAQITSWANACGAKTTAWRKQTSAASSHFVA